MAVGEPDLDQAVEKFGKQSRHTRGTIVDHFWSGDFQQPTGGLVDFADCMKIAAVGGGNWAVPGDSGSIIFGESMPGSSVKRAVGLHIGADEDDPTHGIACRISNVFETLQLRSFPDGAIHRAFASGPALKNEGLVSAMADELRNELMTGHGGWDILSLLDKHRVIVVNAIHRHPEVQAALAAFIGAMFSDVTTVDSVLGRPLSDGDVKAATALLMSLQERLYGDPRRACTSLLSRMSGARGRTLAVVLGLGRTGREKKWSHFPRRT
jgi:hypothetical protein